MRKPEPDVNFALVPAVRLRRLAAADADAAPYDFAEFQRRSDLATVRPGSLSSARGAALAAAVSGLLLGAVLWQQLTLAPGAATSGDEGTAVLAQRADSEADDSASPALVRAGSLVARSELEERIAFFDAVLSESRVGSAQPERLAALEQGRSELVDSLQRVHYAEQLMAP